MNNLVVADATLGNDSVLAMALFDLLRNTRELEYMAHQFHWNIVGVKFNTMHEFYEEEYKQLFEDQDEIAEQIRQQGFFVPVINNVLLEENYSASGFEEQLIAYSGKLTQNIALIDKVNDLAKNEIAVQDLCARLKGLRGLSLNLKVKAMLGANKMSLEPSEANVVESAAKETPLLERILHSWASKKGYKVNKWNHGMNIQFDILPSNFNQTTDKEYENAVIFVIQIDEKDRVARVKTNSFGDSLCNLNLDAIGTASTRKLNSIFDSFIPVTDYWGCLVYKPYPTFRKIQTDRKIAKETASAVKAGSLNETDVDTFLREYNIKARKSKDNKDSIWSTKEVEIHYNEKDKTVSMRTKRVKYTNIRTKQQLEDAFKRLFVEAVNSKATAAAKELFKEGDRVNISGDISNGDYNCRVSSTGIVEENQKTSSSKVRVTIDEIDGDKKVSMLVNPSIVTLASAEKVTARPKHKIRKANDEYTFVKKLAESMDFESDGICRWERNYHKAGEPAVYMEFYYWDENPSDENKLVIYVINADNNDSEFEYIINERTMKTLTKEKLESSIRNVYEGKEAIKVTAGFDKGRYKEINKESDFFKMLRDDCGIRNKNFYTINKGLRLALNIIKGTFEEASIRYFLLKNVGGYIRVELNDKVYIVGYTIYDTGKIKVWTKELKSAVPVNSFDYSMLNSYAKIGTKLVRGMLPTWLSV